MKMEFIFLILMSLIIISLQNALNLIDGIVGIETSTEFSKH